MLSSSVSMLSASTSIMAALNSAVNVSATCIGSLMPVLSMTTYSTSLDRARRASSDSRSPRRVQQMQPFWSWMSFSLVWETLWCVMRAASMLSLWHRRQQHDRSIEGVTVDQRAHVIDDDCDLEPMVWRF